MQKFFLTLFLFINAASGQTLQCQAEKEALIQEYRKNQQMNPANCMTIPDPMQRANCQLAASGYQIGGALGQSMGGQSLESRIQDWERRCNQR